MAFITMRRLSLTTSGSARRRARERQRAQQTRSEGERIAREQREEKSKEKLEYQRLARRELASYEPWGRSGGGAPNAHGVRYKDLRSRGIYPEDELKGFTQYEACFRWPSPRRQRCTPIRLREDPQICFSEQLRKTVDNDIRYRKTPDQQKFYKEALDGMVDERKKALKDEVRRNLEYEQEMNKIDTPWGKPGPGGSIWRNPRNVGLNFSNSMGWTDNDKLKKMKDDCHRKRSSLTLPIVKRDDDLNHTTSIDKVKYSKVDKLPSIANRKDENLSINTNTKKQKKKFVKRLSNGERINRDLSDDSDVKVVTDMNTSLNEKKPTPEAAILRVTGGIELVPILARKRRVGARNLTSSDVTRPPEQPCEWREVLHTDYLRELKHQMRVKGEIRKERRQDSAESVKKHHETWASLWGRPGHGAPQCRGKYNRGNLVEMLYIPPLARAK